ncbi:hypothetical protein THAOC_22920 [Thalassiosira oceanica]|uniref:Cyclin-like domain-containing protein n=1 Tax=Thalassiosira oceanica TaxID=159749 RepID=K0S867_THAOC|nr:hypothetical protein THAOC_22920 [Thalassiosira oceanica]|eukprot:EJK57076.1 hypothetical protein THAOC_22920 [Thalassiosira oceanica]
MKKDEAPVASEKFVVDKTVHACIEISSRISPSNKDGISAQVERMHRLHGASILHDACQILKLPSSVFATACTIFHRMYHRISLRAHCVWSVALGCTLLASKVDEEPRQVRTIIVAFVHIYRRRRLRAGDDVKRHSYGAADCEAEGAASLTNGEKENVLRSVPPLPMGGPVYAEWKEVLMNMESTILRTLGFTLYWIPDKVPQRFVLYFCRVLEIERKAQTVLLSAKVIQQAWSYLNDSCFLDLCVRYEPELTVSSSDVPALAPIYRADNLSGLRRDNNGVF